VADEQAQETTAGAGGEGAAEGVILTANGTARFANGAPLQEWATEAYAAHIGRSQSILSIAKHYGVEWETVKRNIEAIEAWVQVIEQSDVLTAKRKHKARLTEIIKAGWQGYTKAEDEGTRNAILRTILDASEKLAAADGVVTERKGVAVGQDPTLGPVQVALVPDARLAEIIARGRARNGDANGHGPKGQAADAGDSPSDAAGEG
jgi:hypothetical protein